ncbi:MAG TPA: hypothetical protein VFZ98_14030, partial [Vicinamibacterales bacterium]
MALRGISGSLVSNALLEGEAKLTDAPAELRRIVSAVRQLGPASSARNIFDALIGPLLRHFELEWSIAIDSTPAIVAIVDGRKCHALIVTGGWDADLHELRRRTARTGERACRWWIGANGAMLRVLDASRAYTRRALDFDVALIADNDGAIGALRHVLQST